MNELDELEDFEVTPAKYELWITGYDQFNKPTDFSTMFNTYEDPDEAISVATRISIVDVLNYPGANACDYFIIEVDALVLLDESVNTGTVYRTTLKFEKPAINLKLSFSDYELTEFCDLKIMGKIAKPFKVGDYINAIVGEEHEPVILKVYSKEPNFILCEFID